MIKNFLSNDIKTKVLSLSIAAVLWIYLVIVLNPEVDVTITDIPITYSGHLTLTQNKFVITNEAQTYVDLKLRGPRKMLADVNKNNIFASIDLTGYSNAGEYTIPVQVRLPFAEIEVLQKNPPNIPIIIDYLVTQQFQVEVLFTGTPQEGYSVHSPATTQNLIEVSGPGELIKNVDKAAVEIDVDGASSDVVALAKIVLLNSNGDLIEHNSITVTPEKVETFCTLLRGKSVPVVCVFDGDSDLYSVKFLSNEYVIIFGKDDILATISEIKTTPISVGDIVGNMQMYAPLAIPDEVYTDQKITEVPIEIRYKNE